MDTEEAREIAHHAAAGIPHTDEGPYYHQAWGKSYKGLGKGIAGGLFIGSGLGAAMGLVSAALIGTLVMPLAPAAFAGIALGFAGLGAVIGIHELSAVGAITGAVAAAHKQAEERGREYEDSRFADLKREIRGLKAILTGRSEQAAMAECEPETLPPEEVEIKQKQYRNQHCDEEHCGEPFRPVFWKVAAVGAGIGAAAGALLGYTGMMGEFMDVVNHALHLPAPLSGAQLVGVSSIVGGAAGFTFGINRDLSRQAQDTADILYKGLPPASEEQTRAAALNQARGMAHGCSERVLIEPGETQECPGTFFQDKLKEEAAMRLALLKLDHTRATSQ